MEHNNNYSLNSSGQNLRCTTSTGCLRLQQRQLDRIIPRRTPIHEALRGTHMSTAIGSIVLVFFFLAALTDGQTPDSPTGAAPAEYRPEGSIRGYFLGAWKLVATEDKYSDGRTTPYPALGRDAVGFLMYTPSGHMCAQLMKAGRTHWSQSNTPNATEAASAPDGFISYCGTFEIREDAHLMIHRLETAAFPNYPGTTQERPYHLVNKDRFFFRGASTEKRDDGSEVPVTWTITWERLK